MTTPTPDQGALERAHEIYWNQTINGKVILPPDQRHPLVCVPAITAALTAAASEARAAAIEQCIETLDGYKQGIIDNEDWPDQDAELLDTLDSAIHMLRALATPAQSDGK